MCSKKSNTHSFKSDTQSFKSDTQFVQEIVADTLEYETAQKCMFCYNSLEKCTQFETYAKLHRFPSCVLFWSQGYKIVFMRSTEHEIYHAHKY